MRLPDWLVQRLRCPERPDLALVPASEATLARLDALARAGALRHRDGGQVRGPVTEALVREDGRLAYVAHDRVWHLAIGDGIEVVEP